MPLYSLGYSTEYELRWLRQPVSKFRECKKQKILSRDWHKTQENDQHYTYVWYYAQCLLPPDLSEIEYWTESAKLFPANYELCNGLPSSVCSHMKEFSECLLRGESQRWRLNGRSPSQYWRIVSVKTLYQQMLWVTRWVAEGFIKSNSKVFVRCSVATFSVMSKAKGLWFTEYMYIYIIYSDGNERRYAWENSA